MSDMAVIARLILVPLGFFLALIASAFVLFTLGMERFTHAIEGDWLGPDGMTSVFAIVSQGLIIASVVSLVPALLFVIVGEVARIRSLLYYMVGGGIALAAAPLAASFADAGTLQMPPAAVWQVTATAGFFGGFVYWLVAGRSA